MFGEQLHAPFVLLTHYQLQLVTAWPSAKPFQASFSPTRPKKVAVPAAQSDRD